ncbi:leucine-rich repeat domain-containing protein, partial [Candidatus Poribacteria bacterium]|nr:leucine-rich repeat domain-containing protein [Candidatus Poribacteria bacterium]
LRSLYLSDNNLTQLPEFIGQLTQLRSLDLSYTNLTQLPEFIGQLTQLRSLDLSYNRLSEVPEFIGQLTQLRSLDLRSNRLSEVPEFIGQFTQLRSLDLRSNRLSEVPEFIGQLTQLRNLDLSFNRQLTQLPEFIGQLTQLRSLYLSYNNLTQLPEFIGQLTQLRSLYLSYNNLTKLPETMNRLKNLWSLFLAENAELNIPSEVVKLSNEPADIISYYLENVLKTPAEKKPLNEAKMLVVGQASVGKTSLVKRLTEGTFDPREDTTKGINRKPWQITVGGADIQLNIWDFGGQEIMHATHQFFLTRRSVYLLVLDSRNDEAENRLHYWLKIIENFGGDSPVIVVCNKSDQHHFDCDWNDLRSKYPTIREILEQVSCQDGDGIDELCRTIERVVDTLPDVKNPLAASWFDVKAALTQMKEDYIPYTDYERMCSEHGIDNETSQRTLIGFLHDLGIVLHYRDHPLLETTNVLNPEWVTQAVYDILNDRELKVEHQGRLERKMLARILERKRYPRDKDLFILDVMRKFELCFDFEGHRDEKLLIPDLLPKRAPDTGDWSDSLRFEYHYDVLPSSVISRFIVKMHQSISEETYWRNGVVLKQQENRALVKADPEEGKILIFVKGRDNTRRDFLSRIREHFDTIHSTIAKMQAVEKVPVPDAPDVVVDYKHLLDLEAQGIENFPPEGLRGETVNVKEMLDGVTSLQDRRLAGMRGPREMHFEVHDEMPPIVRRGQQLAEVESSVASEEIDRMKEELEAVKRERQAGKKRRRERDEAKAKRFARWAVGLPTFALAVVCAVLLYVYLFEMKTDWDKIEPVTFFVGVVLGLAGGVWSIFFPEKGLLKRLLGGIAEWRAKKYSAEFEVEDEHQV